MLSLTHGTPGSDAQKKRSKTLNLMKRPNSSVGEQADTNQIEADIQKSDNQKSESSKIKIEENSFVPK